MRTMILTLVTVLWSTANLCAELPPTDMLAARVVDDCHGGKKTYAQAYAESLATGKPLVVWNGDALCPACVKTTEDEFVNCVTDELGAPGKDCVTVFVPEGGQMMTAGRLSWWQTGDKTFGHVPSVRRLLANWRSRRTASFQDAPQSYQGLMMVQASNYSFGMGAPMMQRSMSRMSRGSGGACASCR